jgi:hypothetical protein
VKLPAGERAIVDDAKIRDYLLSLEHPVGRSKAKFFQLMGFTRERCDELQQQLLALARIGEAVIGPATDFGQQYVVRGMIDTPLGRQVMIQSAWIVLNGEDFPRFVTAIPGGRK